MLYNARNWIVDLPVCKTGRHLASSVSLIVHPGETMYRDMIALICMTIGVILFILGVMLFERLLYRMEPSSPKWRWLLCLTWLPMIVFSIGSVILAGEHHVGYGVLAIGAYYLTQQWREVLFFLLYPYHKEFHQ